MNRKATFGSLLGLLRGESETALPETPEAWEAIVRIASAHLVLPALDPALCRLNSSAAVASGAAEFLAEVHAENVARNRGMREALLAFGQSFSGRAIVLKGGAFLLEDAEGAAGWRFSTDIDILVPDEATADATAVFEGLGFIADRRDYLPERDAHTPALVSPCRQFSVELHQRLFAEPICAPLAERLPANALSLGRLAVPAPADRMALLIAHSQLHHHFYDLKRLHLRDSLDFQKLMDRQGGRIDWADVGAAFSTINEQRALQAFLAAQPRLLGKTQLPIAPNRWANTAIARLTSSPRARAAASALDAGRAELKNLAGNPRRLLRLAAELNNPQLIRQRIRRRAEKFLSVTWG